MVLGDSTVHERLCCGAAWCSNAVPRPGGSGEIMVVVGRVQLPTAQDWDVGIPLAQPSPFSLFLLFPTHSQRAAKVLRTPRSSQGHQPSEAPRRGRSG